MGEFRFEFNISIERNALLEARGKREYYVLCREARVTADIEDATTNAGLSEIAKKRGLCDYSDFNGLGLQMSKMLLRVITRLLYKYPRLRSRTCFIGSKSGFIKTMQVLMAGDKDMIKKFSLHHICDSETAKDIAGQAAKMAEGFESREADGSNTLAMALQLCGLLDAVILDEADFKDAAFSRLCKELKLNEKSGHHPKGCSAPESVMYHEFGHQLDFLLEVSKDARIFKRFTETKKEAIEKGLSSYAATSIMEYVAEGFAEYMVSPMPRNTAGFIADILNGKYRELKN